MAPKLQIPKTVAAAVKEDSQNISGFFNVKRKPGRPKKATMETPEETEQAIASVLEAQRRRGRPRKKQQPPSSSGQKGTDPPVAPKDVAPKAKRRRVNWSKGEPREKLQAALAEWKEGAVDENGGALPLLGFANIVGIPERTFRDYASGKKIIGASVGRKSIFSKETSGTLVDLIVRHDRGNDPKSVPEVIDIGQKLNPELSRKQISNSFRRTVWRNNQDVLKPNCVRVQAATTKRSETKRLRLEKPFPTFTDKVTTTDALHDTTVALTPADDNHAAAADDDNHADADPVIGMHPNARATGTPKEAATLAGAVTNNSKIEHGKDYRTCYAAVSVLVSDQALHSSIDLVPERRGIQWTPDEDIQLKYAVQQIHDGKNWDAIAALVPGRTNSQCRRRWHCALDHRHVVRTAGGRTGKWTTDEDTRLKDAVHIHGGKDWDGIARIVPGRTYIQCRSRWIYMNRKGSTFRK
jgi:hypothetical protein